MVAVEDAQMHADFAAASWRRMRVSLYRVRLPG
jgi:hypothetical protein